MPPTRRLHSLAFQSLTAVALVGIAPAHAGMPVVRVDADAVGANNGSSWADAFTRLDVALAAAPGAEVWVAEGVYAPPPAEDGDRRLTWFTVPAGTRIYGGFAGNELVREARDPALHRTVLSGDLDGDDTVDAAGITRHVDGIVGENAHHVVVFDAAGPQVAIGADTRIDGVVISAGHASSSGVPRTWGGGAQCISGPAPLSCSPTIANIEFLGNYALDRGGAWISYGDSALSQPRFENVLFRDNLTHGEGGAVFIDGLQGPQQVHMEDMHFEGNSAGAGGALFVSASAEVIIDRASFVANQAQATDDFFAEGGAIYNYGDYSGTSAVRVFNAVFRNNSAIGRGGVVFNTSDGGNAMVELVNATASGNSAGRGGVLYSEGEPSVVSRIHNSILWGNTATENAFPGGNNVYGAYYGYNVPTGHRVEVAYSVLEDGLASPGIVYDEDNAFPSGFLADVGGNLSGNPRLASPALRVRAGSPAIDAGDNARNATDFDVAGLERRFDGDRNGSVRIDIGAHEFGADALFADGFED